MNYQALMERVKKQTCKRTMIWNKSVDGPLFLAQWIKSLLGLQCTLGRILSLFLSKH